MYRLPPLLCFLFFFSSIVFAEDPYFHRVEAKYGDNINLFLARYELDKQSCNFTKFYELNGLNQNSLLQEGQRYFIPVLIYRYNGVSIRTTLGLSTWEQAYRIKKYNERILQNGYRRKSIEKSKVLWVAYHELNCLGKKIIPPKETTPSNSATILSQNTKIDQKEALDRRKELEKDQNKIDEAKLVESKKLSGYRKFPIFGKKHAYIPLTDNELRGKVFYVVSGHGGPDSGAVGKKGNQQLCEDEYAYDVALRLVRNLLQHGAIAYMITRDPNDGLRSGEMLPCDKDEYCWGNYKIPSKVLKDFYEKILGQQQSLRIAAVAAAAAAASSGAPGLKPLNGETVLDNHRQAAATIPTVPPTHPLSKPLFIQPPPPHLIYAPFAHQSPPHQNRTAAAQSGVSLLKPPSLLNTHQAGLLNPTGESAVSGTRPVLAGQEASTARGPMCHIGRVHFVDVQHLARHYLQSHQGLG
ncbi:MAG: hypothetical protein AAF985_13245, partial [Bacteroidota bacterium]